MASNKKKRLEAIADHLALQASQEPQDEFIMDLVSTPEGIVVNTNEAVDFFKASDVMMKQAELVPNDNNNAGPSWRIVDDSAGGTVAQQKEAPTENPGPSREAVAGGKVAQQEQTSEGSDSEQDEAPSSQASGFGSEGSGFGSQEKSKAKEKSARPRIPWTPVIQFDTEDEYSASNVYEDLK